MKISDYQKVIEIIVKGDYNSKDICVKLAQQRPDIFLKLAEKTGSITDIDATILGFMRENRKIMAIKYHRGETNASLVESKNYVETLAAKHGL